MRNRLMALLLGFTLWLPIVGNQNLILPPPYWCEVKYDDGFERLEECHEWIDGIEHICSYFYQNDQLIFSECVPA